MAAITEPYFFRAMHPIVRVAELACKLERLSGSHLDCENRINIWHVKKCVVQQVRIRTFHRQVSYQWLLVDRNNNWDILAMLNIAYLTTRLRTLQRVHIYNARKI